VKFQKPYIDAGATRSGLGGYVQPAIPKKTACYACLGAIDLTHKKKEQGEPCTASLPSTMAILAGIQVQELLKYFFKLGEMASYLLYDGITNQIQEIKLKRDPNCPICGDQVEYSIPTVPTKQNDAKIDDELQNEIKKLGEL
jgi:molybdopterin/thiamine biosynthesis adenylyltransferase